LLRTAKQLAVLWWKLVVRKEHLKRIPKRKSSLSSSGDSL
jgi:hypothetical protein